MANDTITTKLMTNNHSVQYSTKLRNTNTHCIIFCDCTITIMTIIDYLYSDYTVTNHCDYYRLYVQ